jgi:hypothetical protein
LKGSLEGNREEVGEERILRRRAPLGSRRQAGGAAAVNYPCIMIPEAVKNKTKNT